MQTTIYYNNEDAYLISQMGARGRRERESRSAFLLSILEDYFEKPSISARSSVDWNVALRLRRSGVRFLAGVQHLFVFPIGRLLTVDALPFAHEFPNHLSIERFMGWRMLLIRLAFVSQAASACRPGGESVRFAYEFVRVRKAAGLPATKEES